MEPITIRPLGNITPLPPLAPMGEPMVGIGAPSGGATFSQILGQVLGATNDANAKADKAILALATGEADDLHTVSLAVAQADLTFRMLLEMRNRLTEAYQEVMRMQV